MADSILKNSPSFNSPFITSISGCPRYGKFKRFRVPATFGSWSRWGLNRRTSVIVSPVHSSSELDLVYASENSDGSVVFRFGTAREISEYEALKEVRNGNEGVEVEGDAEEVSNSTAGISSTENEVGVLDSEILVEEEDSNQKGFSDLLEEDEVGFMSDSSENAMGEQISGDFVDVSDASSLDSESNVSAEEASSSEYKERILDVVTVSDVGNVGLVENTNRSYEQGLATVEEAIVSNDDVKGDLENEFVAVENASVSDDGSVGDVKNDYLAVEISDVYDRKFQSAEETEFEIVENLSVYDEEFEGKEVEGSVSVESSISDDKLVGNVANKSVSVKNVVSDVSFEPDEDLGSTTPVVDIITSTSIERPSTCQDKEDIFSHSVLSGSLAFAESVTSSEINFITPTSGMFDNGVETNDVLELSNVEKTSLSNDDFESQDKEIAFDDGTLAFEKELIGTGDKGSAVVDGSHSKAIYYDELEDLSSLPNILSETISVSELPSESEKTSEQKNEMETTSVYVVSTTEGDFFNENSEETNAPRQDRVVIATPSSILEDAHRTESVMTMPVATTLETEIVLNEMFHHDLEEDVIGRICIESLNMIEGNPSPATEISGVREVDSLSDSSMSISVSEAAEHRPTLFFADRKTPSPVEFGLSIGATLLPHTLEALTGGEDAYFVAGTTWFGVADGVGEWSLEGLDIGLYAHELMENCKRILSDTNILPPQTNPKELLCHSAAQAQLPGSATILVAYFDGQVFHAANIGDTGFLIVRNGAVLSRSSPTVHDFHFPHQIQRGDDPLEFVEWYEIEVDAGDVIIAATDGLFDNLYDQEIASITTKSLQANLSPEEVAAILAVRAQEIGKSTSTRSPFADAAQAAGYAGYTGGKLDDVAVIVSVVQKRSSS